MVGMRVRMRGWFQRTVWSHYNTANIPPRYQLIYTLMLPLKFALIGLYGALSISVPITSIDLIFGPIYGDMWSFALMVSGLGAFVGICFYARLIWVEAIALIMMVTLMALYVGAIFTAAILGAESFRFLSMLLVLVFLPMPSWRVWDIVRELRPPRHVS